MPASTTATGDTAIWAADDGAALIGKGRHRMAGGVAASLLLHAAVLLLIACGLLRFPPPPAGPADRTIPVDLVRLEPAKSVTDVIPADALPETPAPALQPPTAAHQAVSGATIRQPENVPPETASPETAPAEKAGVEKARIEKTPTGKAGAPRKVAAPLPAGGKTAPADPLTLRLRELAQQKLATAPAPPGTGAPSGAGLPKATTDSAAATGPQGIHGARDFLRAQVIRHWNLRVEPSQAADWRVSIHLQLRRDGSVAVAEIVDPARYRLNRPYFDFAISARNAVLMSSPLVIPPGQYELVADIILPFSARDVLQ